MASDEPRAWRRSTRCDTNSCVEVATADEGEFIRNSRESEGSALTFTRAEWDAFVAGVKDGEF